jgi:hypothetical protein
MNVLGGGEVNDINNYKIIIETDNLNYPIIIRSKIEMESLLHVTSVEKLP